MFDGPLRAYLRERLGLDKTPLNLLVAIIQLSRNERGHCWARLRFLGERIERAARTVRHALKVLRERGFVHAQPTGRNLICTPNWDVLGLDPETAAPASGARRTEPTSDVPAEPAQGPKRRPPEADGRPPPGAEESTPAAANTEPVHADIEPALTAIRHRFGDQAGRDVADLLSAHGNPSEATRTALDRMLTVEPSHIKHTVGGYFRRLLGLANDDRLPPRCASSVPPSPSDPIEQAVKVQAELVHALARQIERTEVISDERTQLTRQRHLAIDQLAALQRRKDARETPAVKSPVVEAPPRRPPPRMPGPPPAWAAKFIPSENSGMPRPP